MDTISIKNIELLNIEARRFLKSGEKMKEFRVESNSSVLGINAISDKEAAVEFQFIANYVINIGAIKLEGRLLFEGDSKQIVAKWQETRQMPEEMAQAVHSAVLNKCIPTAVLLARDINLPPPIPLPQIKIKAKQPAKSKYSDDTQYIQ